MIREEALKILKEPDRIGYNIIRANDEETVKYNTKSQMALNMAIKALEQEPCEDAISRQEVLDGLASIAKAKAKSDAQKSLMGRVMFFTEHLLSVAPQPKTGHWKDIMVGDMPAQACDRCNTFYPLAYTGGGHKYCPNCGAKMEVSN